MNCILRVCVGLGRARPSRSCTFGGASVTLRSVLPCNPIMGPQTLSTANEHLTYRVDSRTSPLVPPISQTLHTSKCQLAVLNVGCSATVAKPSRHPCLLCHLSLVPPVSWATRMLLGAWFALLSSAPSMVSVSLAAFVWTCIRAARVNAVNVGWTLTDNEHIIQQEEMNSEEWLAEADKVCCPLDLFLDSRSWCRVLETPRVGSFFRTLA